MESCRASSCGLTVCSPAAASPLAGLEWCDLKANRLNAAGCRALAEALDAGALPALRHLHLHLNPASDAELDAVAAALSRAVRRSTDVPLWGA